MAERGLDEAILIFFGRGADAVGITIQTVATIFDIGRVFGNLLYLLELGLIVG